MLGVASMILEAARAEPFVTPDAFVIDLGANVGEFSRWALERGASVLAVEPVKLNVDRLVDLAKTYPQLGILHAGAGPSGRGVVVFPEDSAAWSTGAVAIPEPDGSLPMFNLAEIIGITGRRVDVLKVDIQGGEYALFDEADDTTLRRCRLITIERHAWTTSDEPAREGWGVSDARPMPSGAYEAIVDRMARTHRVEIEGDTLFCYETP